MKKRIISLVLVVVLVCAMSLSVSAVSTYGKTTGGSNTYAVTATLVGSKTLASATTKTSCSKEYIHHTYVAYTYKNIDDQIVIESASGNKVATIYPNVYNSASGICADSQHEVNGGATDGNWSGSLHIVV